MPPKPPKIWHVNIITKKGYQVCESFTTETEALDERDWIARLEFVRTVDIITAVAGRDDPEQL